MSSTKRPWPVRKRASSTRRTGLPIPVSLIPLPSTKATPPRIPVYWSSLRQQAEALRLHAERRVELAAEVLERDRRSELDDLRLAELRPQPSEQPLVHFLAGVGHPLGILKRHVLELAERAAFAPAAK